MASSSAQPSADEMRRIISNAETPIVFRGFIDSWPMIKFSADDWRSFFGDLSLDCRVGDRQNDTHCPQWEREADAVECNYDQFTQWLENGNVADSMCHITPRQHFLYFNYKYMKDICGSTALPMVDWSPFGYPGRNGNESTFWMGTAGAHTPCHYDTYGCNLVAQVSGKKRWILYPPEDTPLLEPSRIPYEESSVYSQINFQRWKETEVPDISGSHPHVVILYPGDVLFVPRHWWHYVHNVQLSISINTWLERPEDEEARLAEGLVKYFMANISRNISPDLSSTLLNPNEEETAFVELEDVENCIRHSFRYVMDHPQPSESTRSPPLSMTANNWMTPVTFSHVPLKSPEAKKPKTSTGDLKLFDIVRAFCDQRTVQTIIEVLKEQQ